MEPSYLERQDVTMWPLAIVQLNLHIFCGYILLIPKFYLCTCDFFLYDSIFFLEHFVYFFTDQLL